MGVLINALLKKEFKLDKIPHIDNSPDVIIGNNLVNNNSEHSQFKLSCEIPYKTYHGLELFLEPAFHLRNLRDGFVDLFEVHEIIDGERSLIMEIGEQVKVNFDSEFYKDSLVVIEPDGRPASKPSEGSGLKTLEHIKVDTSGLEVIAKIFSDEQGILRGGLKNQQIVEKLLDSLFLIFNHTTQNDVVDWIGPNRTVSDKNFTVNDEKDFIYPQYLNSHTIDKLNEWLETNSLIDLDYQFVFNEVQLGSDTSLTSPNIKEFGLKHRGVDEFLNLSEVGSGIAHIFQILLSLFHEPGIVIIQQPEIHLHPGMQVQFARAIIDLSNRNGTQLIIETHSEHFIKAAQLEIAKNLNSNSPRLSKDDLSVLYISRDESGFSNVKQMELDETGAFAEPWPDDFFELSADLTLERLRNSYKGRN